MKQRNGFTLAELLGVIVILAILVLVAFPPIVNEIRKTKSQLNDATLKLVYSAAEIYIDNNQNTYPFYDGNNYCISLQTLVNSGDLKEPVNDVETGQPISLEKIVRVNIVNRANIDYSLVDSGDCVVVDNTPIVNADNSGANAPMLSDNMIPIRWNGVDWVKADKRNPVGENQWYNYDNQEWANVILVNSTKRDTYNNMAVGDVIDNGDVMAYLVWVPRFKYKLFNPDASQISAALINVTFESKSTAKSTGTLKDEDLTHPAFTLGTKELSGIWVGKFETTGNATTPTIKPNSVSLTNQNAKAQFDTAAKFDNSVVYGLSAINDSHMMKSVEWGAVAYLSQSKYGKYGNSYYTDAQNLEKAIYINNINSDIGGGTLGTITGCAGDTLSASVLPSTTCPTSNQYDTAQGEKASTTGNIYGVYDMSGGSAERAMGVMLNSDKSTLQIGSSGFTQTEIDGSSMLNYVNKYAYGETVDDADAYLRRILGDSTGETRYWNEDTPYMIYNGESWLIYGSTYKDTAAAGVFAFNTSDGGAGGNVGFRVTILGE